MSNRGAFPLGGDKPLPPAPLANRQAATGSGRIFVATDNGGTTFQDVPGQGWVQLGASVIDPRLNVSGVVPSVLRKTRLKLGGAQSSAGVGACKIAVIGDSTSAGTGATAGSTDWPSQIVSNLTSRGFTSGGVATAPANSSGLWVTTGWSFDGQALLNNGVAAGTNATYTSTNTGTIVRFIYTDTAFSGSFTYAVDGGSATTVNISGAGTAKLVSVTGLANTTHTLTITAGSAGLFDVHSAWVESASGVVLNNQGISGTTTADWTAGVNASSAARALGSVQTFAPDLTLLMLGINDILSTLGADRSYANLRSIVTTMRTAGSDVILISPIPSSSRDASGQVALLAALKRLSSDLSLPFLDLYDRWGTGAQLLSGYSGDGLHGTASSYGDVARAVLNIIGT